jgi:YbgC/YbaW family acyl-CoA thioester hydrolase
MPFEFRRVRRVEFADTDMAGIVHFSQFFRYMEETEHAFFRSLGVSIHGEYEGRMIGWPRVHASCDYLRPLRFEEEVEVQLLVREKRGKSLSYGFHFRKVSEPETEIARGALTVVCAALDAHTGKLRAITIPAGIADQIEVAPGDPEVTP